MIRSMMRITATCAALVAVLACGGSEESATVSAADVKEETREAIEVTADYAAAQREELAARAKQVIEEVDHELDQARSKALTLEDEARERLESAIDRAVAARKELGAEIGRLADAEADRWETVKQRCSDALDELREARGEVAAALAGRSEDGNPS